MAYLAVDKDGKEQVFQQKPYWNTKYESWFRESRSENERVVLPKGSIQKLIGRTLTYEDEPIILE